MSFIIKTLKLNDVTMIVFDLRIFQQELAMMNQPAPAFK